MEMTRDQPFNIFDTHRAQTQPMRFLIYLLMITGILLSVWLIQSHKAMRLSTSPTDSAFKTGHGWSLDLTDKEL